MKRGQICHISQLDRFSGNINIAHDMSGAEWICPVGVDKRAQQFSSQGCWKLAELNDVIS